MKLTIDGESFEVEVRPEAVVVNGVPFTVAVEGEGVGTTVTVAGRRLRMHRVGPTGEEVEVNVEGRIYRVRAEGLLRAARAPSRGAAQRHKRTSAAPGAVTALMPGRVLAVRVTQGQAVKTGDILLILEAMKMENEIHSPVDGVVKELPVAPGASVVAGDVLAVVEEVEG